MILFEHVTVPGSNVLDADPYDACFIKVVQAENIW
jgi:hypothetical protein